MKDILNFKGHFKVESVDKCNNIIDVWEEPNLIMESARESIAEMFASLITSTGINKFVLGSKGHTSDYRIPKTLSEGFVSTRDRLFSESVDVVDGESLTLLKGDVIKYTGNTNITGTQNNYYEYTGTGETIAVSSIDFAISWIDLGSSAPYTYNIEFDLPEISSGNGLNIVEDDGAVGSTVEINQVANEVEFTYVFSNATGNQANDPVQGASTFTEAAMYMNGRIFCMKTFPAKMKDNSSILRITWTIAF